MPPLTKILKPLGKKCWPSSKYLYSKSQFSKVTAPGVELYQRTKLPTSVSWIFDLCGIFSGVCLSSGRMRDAKCTWERLENFEIVCEETTRKGARALFLGIFGQRALKLMVPAQHTRIISRIRIRPKNWAKFFLAVKQSRTTKQNRNIPPIRFKKRDFMCAVILNIHHSLE